MKLIQNGLESGTSTSITIGIHEPKNPNQLFDPIPADLLFMATDEPQLKLSVNKRDAVCDP